MGIEPTYPAWKAGVLPLNYTRKKRYKFKFVSRTKLIIASLFADVNDFLFNFYTLYITEGTVIRHAICHNIAPHFIIMVSGFQTVMDTCSISIFLQCSD